MSLKLAEVKCYCHTPDQAKADKLIGEVARWSIDTDDWGAGAYCSLHYAEWDLATVGLLAKTLYLVQGTERGMVFAGDFEGIIRFLTLLARVRLALNDFDKAREHVLRAHELVTIYKDAILLAHVTNGVGMVEAQAASLTTAREWFTRAAQLADEYGLPLEAGLARMNAGLTWTTEDKRLSEVLLQQASDLIEPLGLYTYTNMIRRNIRVN